MLVSMVNLVVFSDDPVTGYGGSPRHRGVILPSSHQYQYPAVRFPASHIVQKVKGQAPPTKSSPTTPPPLPKSSTTSTPTHDESHVLNQTETEAQQQLNNVTLLLGNLSAAFPSLRNLIQQSVRLPASANHTAKDGSKVTMDAVSETIDSFFQQQRLKLANRHPDPATGSANPGDANHYLYHSNRSRTLRKNTPTRPSEIILVVSGCLFFITFFLGTFAQIKSEVSFYTMVLRFIHWNQQWIIEEYDPDGGQGTSGEDEETGSGAQASPESDTESIKDFVSPSHSNSFVVDAEPVCVQVEQQLPVSTCSLTVVSTSGSSFQQPTAISSNYHATHHHHQHKPEVIDL